MPFETGLQDDQEKNQQFGELIEWFFAIINIQADTEGMINADVYQHLCRKLMAGTVAKKRAPENGRTNKRDLLDELIWKWTESYGKYAGCQYWSNNAYNLFVNYPNADDEPEVNTNNQIGIELARKHKHPPNNELRDPSQRIEHEHVFPKENLVRYLCSAYFLHQHGHDLRHYLTCNLPRLCVGCVVTHQEHENIFRCCNFANPRMRYQGVIQTIHAGYRDAWGHARDIHSAGIQAAGLELILHPPN